MLAPNTNAQDDQAKFDNADEQQVALPMRSHTILGVCEAIGEDFGINPTLIRVPFAAMVLWSPVWAIAAYFAVGLVILASRLLAPKQNDVADVQDAAQPTVHANSEMELRKAA